MYAMLGEVQANFDCSTNQLRAMLCAMMALTDTCCVLVLGNNLQSSGGSISQKETMVSTDAADRI